MIGLTNLATRNEWIRHELLSIPAGKHILDAGAGELQWKDTCKHLQYISQDLCQYDGIGDGKGLQCKGWNGMKVDIISDIINIPRSDESFDVILCSEVLDHVPDPPGAIKELIRLLKKGGIMLITESFCGLTNQSPFFFYTGLSENFYKYWLKDFDLTIKKNGDYFEYQAQEAYRMANWEILIKPYIDILLRLYENGKNKVPNSEDILCFGLLVKAIKK